MRGLSCQCSATVVTESYVDFGRQPDLVLRSGPSPDALSLMRPDNSWDAVQWPDGSPSWVPVRRDDVDWEALVGLAIAATVIES
jgi:hypothetical protein